MCETNKLHIATVCKRNKLCRISCCSNGWSSFTQNTCIMKQCHITKYTYCIFARCKNAKKGRSDTGTNGILSYKIHFDV